ncbi:hypothetical protein IE81DRAFT_40262 [Ceraceosorus guamensis]|uniref:DUF336-domain-containing protein n=1 Tax=Ceraceosorus guamensis TaxID=1522189 RepID=A0A316VS76_9BASI|nr:hypothetical protein IE81DRAFT_40262 [Ceraceosorus guamensis]PWN39263.1 hypothetical protein IE81DRAFT_40262 [Ceraceosorus guamensis]
MCHARRRHQTHSCAVPFRALALRLAYKLLELSSADAWSMGNALRSSALALLSRRRDVTKPGLVFRIQLLSGLVLFQISLGAESSLRLMEMVEKKINVVRTYSHSSLAIGRKLLQQGRSIDSLGPEYAAHGGAFPIRVAGLEAPVAVVAVSGLDQETDHALAREAVREIAERQKAARAAKAREEMDLSKKQV